jgi:hypothetical protein
MIGAGAPGSMKNLIFAADGPKPEIVFSDALNNDVRVVRNERVLPRLRPATGGAKLTWADLTSWWADREGLTGASAREVARSLYWRLDRSLGDNDAERRILRTYAERYVRLGADIPMVAEDRELRLRDYEVYRFGGAELVDTPAASKRLATLFDRLAARYAT